MNKPLKNMVNSALTDGRHHASMRAATILLVLLVATGASAAARRAPPVDGAGLRGSVSAGDPSSPTSAAGVTTGAAKLRRAAAAAPPLASPFPADDGQCRLTCAHSYYRCLAGDFAEQCPQAWTLCLAGCARASSGLR